MKRAQIQCTLGELPLCFDAGYCLRQQWGIILHLTASGKKNPSKYSRHLFYPLSSIFVRALGEQQVLHIALEKAIIALIYTAWSGYERDLETGANSFPTKCCVSLSHRAHIICAAKHRRDSAPRSGGRETRSVDGLPGFNNV